MKHVIIHHTDADGHCSAAVVFHALVHREKVSRSDIVFSSINYGQKLDLSAFDQKNDSFYMVDFSLQPEDSFLEFVKATPKLVWIDHHETAIEIEKKNPELEIIPGVRAADKGAACILCWQYYFKDAAVPLLVDLVSRWDTRDLVLSRRLIGGITKFGRCAGTQELRTRRLTATISRTGGRLLITCGGPMTGWFKGVFFKERLQDTRRSS
jgi:hypothetical protein